MATRLDQSKRNSLTSACNSVMAHSQQEVIEAVDLARRQGYSLYPISTGRNWGYGGSMPVAKSSRILDLSKMNRILNADEIGLDNPVAVIEPGVTQAQLHAFLQERCPELMFNVTGSARDTSILGNSLDRGVGYFGPRREDVFGLEVVTGRGDLLRTGFRRLGEVSPLAHTHPYGFGPMLDGLFFQGNFGIVTSACFRLIPRRPLHAALTMSLHDPSLLGTFVDRLAELKRARVLTSVTHIANRLRTCSSLEHGAVDYLVGRCGLDEAKARESANACLSAVSRTEWSALAAVCDTRLRVAAAVFEIRRQLAGIASVRVITSGMLNLAYPVFDRLRQIPWCRTRAAAIHAIRPLHGLVDGIPTDAPIENLLWKYGDLGRIKPADFEASSCGVLFVSPALPLKGRQVASAVDALEQIALKHRQALYMTLNIEGDTTLVGVMNLLYDKQDTDATARAWDCAEALLERIRQLGLHPYRAHVGMMDSLVPQNDPYWRHIHQLKQIFDPDDIIAPGRYNFPLHADRKTKAT